MRWRPLLETIHLTCVGIWLGVILMAGAAAAVLFPIMKRLDPRLPGFESYEGEHWRIAGGQVGQRLFVIADTVGLVCVIPAAITLMILIQFVGLDRKRKSSFIRGIGLFVAFLAFTWALFMVSPKMHTSAKAYWAAAASGDTETAMVHRQEFDGLHPTASNLMITTACGLLVTFVAGLWSATHPRSERSDGE